MSVSFAVIGRNIREARKCQGFTQEQFAERMDISVLHYGRLERGERTVSLVQLEKISVLLDVSIEELLWGCTDFYSKKIKKEKRNMGTIIQSIAAGCSEEACSLMIDVCQLIAENEKSQSKINLSEKTGV